MESLSPKAQERLGQNDEDKQVKIITNYRSVMEKKLLFVGTYANNITGGLKKTLKVTLTE